MAQATTTTRRSGPHRSLETLQELTGARLGAAGLQRAGRALGAIDWHPAQAYAIQRDDFRDVWHAGHVTALVSNGVDVEFGTALGGHLTHLRTTPLPLPFNASRSG